MPSRPASSGHHSLIKHLWPWTSWHAGPAILDPLKDFFFFFFFFLLISRRTSDLQQYYAHLTFTITLPLHGSVHSLSERWQAMCWWPWTSLTICLWRTWGSSEEPSCTRTATPSQSSSTTDGMGTSACVSWAWKTSQVSEKLVAGYSHLSVLCAVVLCCKFSMLLVWTCLIFEAAFYPRSNVKWS